MKPKRAALYLRVSTTGQTTENQRRELVAVVDRHGWQIVAEYEDAGVSGTKGRDKRPGLDALLKAVARREIDMVAVWSVDRLGRSLKDLLDTLGEFHAKGVGLYLHQQGLDTTTPAGKAMFSMLGVFAEFERAIIVERVQAGLQRARAQGKRLGRPMIDPKKEARVRALRSQGRGILAIAREVGCGVSVVQRIVAAA